MGPFKEESPQCRVFSGLCNIRNVITMDIMFMQCVCTSCTAPLAGIPDARFAK